MPWGNNLFAAKLKYLQRGSGCCKKSEKKWKVWYNGKKSPPIIFSFIGRGYFNQKLPEESDKNGPDALQQRFLV